MQSESEAEDNRTRAYHVCLYSKTNDGGTKTPLLRLACIEFCCSLPRFCSEGGSY